MTQNVTSGAIAATCTTEDASLESSLSEAMSTSLEAPILFPLCSHLCSSPIPSSLLAKGDQTNISCFAFWYCWIRQFWFFTGMTLWMIRGVTSPTLPFQEWVSRRRVSETTFTWLVGSLANQIRAMLWDTAPLIMNGHKWESKFSKYFNFVMIKHDNFCCFRLQSCHVLEWGQSFLYCPDDGDSFSAECILDWRRATKAPLNKDKIYLSFSFLPVNLFTDKV